MARALGDKVERDNRSDNPFIGDAGVHYAAYRLARKLMIALPTVRNTPGTDLVVMSRDGRRRAFIQVKSTLKKTAKFWTICSAKKFEERKSTLGKDDYFLLLRPRRADDPDSGEASEFEGFMLTASQAIEEMQAHLRYKRRQGTEHKYPLCIYVDKGPRERKWNLPHNSKKKWRKRWQEFQM